MYSTIGESLVFVACLLKLSYKLLFQGSCKKTKQKQMHRKILIWFMVCFKTNRIWLG